MHALHAQTDQPSPDWPAVLTYALPSILVTPAPPALGLHACRHRHHLVDLKVLLGREQRVPRRVEFLVDLETVHSISVQFFSQPQPISQRRKARLHFWDRHTTENASGSFPSSLDLSLRPLKRPPLTPNPNRHPES